MVIKGKGDVKGQRKRRLQRKRLLLAKLREPGCSKCGEKHPACLDFHHRDGSEKRGCVSEMVQQVGIGTGALLDEVAKCDLLCANCHRKLHWRERAEPVQLRLVG